MLFPSVEFTSKIFCERLNHKIDYSSWLQKGSWCRLDAGAPGKQSLTAFFAVFPPFLKTTPTPSCSAFIRVTPTLSIVTKTRNKYLL